MSDTSGRSSARRFAEYDRDSSSWKTFPDTGLWGLTEFSGIWPRCGTWDLGSASELPTWEPRISVNECSSLLATPTAWLGRRPAHSLGDPERWTNPERSNELSDQIAHLLPTPTAMDSRSSGGNSPSDVTLTDAVIRTQLGASMNPRFADGNESCVAEPPLPQLWDLEDDTSSLDASRSG